MRTIMCLTTVLFALGIWCAAGGAPLRSDDAGESADEKAVRSRLAEIQDAAERLDPDGVFRFVLENDKGALVQDGRILLTRDDALKSTKQGFKGLSRISYQFDHQHVTLLSPTIALVVGEGDSSATTNDGRTFDTRFAQSVVLMKSDGQWKVAHAHRSFPAAN